MVCPSPQGQVPKISMLYMCEICQIILLLLDSRLRTYPKVVQIEPNKWLRVVLETDYKPL